MSNFVLGTSEAIQNSSSDYNWLAGQLNFSLDWIRLSGWITRPDCVDERWAPYIDSAHSRFICICGRVAWDESTWDHVYEKFSGSASAYLAERWENSRSEVYTLLNGVAAFLIFDLVNQTLHVISDRLGVYPLYVLNNGFFGLSSHPDLLADYSEANGRSLAVDELTIAEGLATSECVGDSTYYKEVKSLDPASHYCFSFSEKGCDISVSPYWRISAKQDETLPFPHWVEKIAQGLRIAMKNRVHRYSGDAALFLSGGADSRALLYACEQRANLTAYTFADSPNPESMVASRIARATGVAQKLLYRDFDHYGANAREAVAVTGGMWSLKDNHIHGFASSLASAKVGTIISGDYADYMFKALAVNKRQVKFLGKGFSLDSYSEFQFQFYQPHVKISHSWTDQVGARLESRFPVGLRSDRHAMEDLRMRPLRRGPDCLQDLWLIRMMPWDPPFTDNALIDVYDALPMKYKLNGMAYGAAIRSLSSPEQQRIENNNTGAPIGAPAWRLIVQDLINKVRNKIESKFSKLRKSDGGLATSGSWPNFSVYIAESPVIASLWASPSERTVSLFSDILGYNPWEKSVAHWGQTEESIQLFLRALTIKLWLDSRGY